MNTAPKFAGWHLQHFPTVHSSGFCECTLILYMLSIFYSCDCVGVHCRTFTDAEITKLVDNICQIPKNNLLYVSHIAFRCKILLVLLLLIRQ